MKKFTAFSLAESTIALVVIGVLAVITLKVLSSDELKDRSKLAKVYKAFNEIESAAAQVKASEPDQCPDKAFMTKVRNTAKNDVFDNDYYTYEYGLFKTDGSYAPASEVAAIFARHMDFEEENLNFCSYTGYCSNNNIKGGKIIGDIYIGFEVTADTSTGTVTNCPTNYWMPNFDKEDYKNHGYFKQITKPKAGKCWGRVYVFIKSRTPENQEGKDIFIWGLDENGIAK